SAAMFRTILKSLTALVIMPLASMALAQQPAAVTTPQPPAPLSSPAASSPAAPTPSAASSAPAVPQIAPTAADTSESPARSLKSTATGLRELSPWSMFMSADIVVKGVIVGLVFASLMTWTVAIAKTIELSALRRRLRQALRKIAEARSLADAQLALGGKDGLL